jgi:hypothetical protein
MADVFEVNWRSSLVIPQPLAAQQQQHQQQLCRYQLARTLIRTSAASFRLVH